MRNIWTIIKKELKRFFTDYRILISLFLPGVMIFFIYSFMGNVLSDSFSTSEDYIYQVYVQNRADSGNELSIMLENALFNVDLKEVENEEITIEEIKDKITNKEVDLLIVFEDNFYENMINYTVNSEISAPNIDIFYNSVETSSQEAYTYYVALFNSYESFLANKFDINGKLDNVKYDLATQEQTTIMVLTSMLPFLLITFLFTASMSITPDSIAGEKERGTIATLLVTPMKRSELALGKIIAISIAALASSSVSFVGLILSLPKLMSMAEIDLSIYGIGTYLAIFGVIVVTELLFVAIISFISSIAKSVKEATGYCSAVMVAIMLLGVTTMVGLSSSNIISYFIPAYNSIQCLNEILSLSFNLVHFLITIGINIIYVILGTFVITKVFNSEKILSNN
ncbi:MAG: ABC transporter permease [Erysipelotrichales bacterium]|nr:ABC transporter permease [Erysipelotrichales bacterium]